MLLSVTAWIIQMMAVRVMKNSVYWRKRFEELEKALNRYGLKAYAIIQPEFDNAAKEINLEIEKWLNRIAKNNEISMAGARKLLDKDQLAEFKWSVEEYIKYGQLNAINQQWMKQLENASAKYHISKLEALKLQTQQAAEAAFGNYLDGVDEIARQFYSESYYRSAFELQKGFGIGWGLDSIDGNKLSKLIAKPWAADGKNFSDRIWTAKTQMVNDLHSELTRACLQGKAPDAAIRNLSQFVNKKFKNAKVQAGRLVMTEQAFFSAAAQKDCFKDLGVEEFEIVATLDSHTSAICQELDGKHYPMSQYEPGVTAPPFHVWCRSTTCPYFDDEFSIGERTARDRNGKTYYVPSNMTYKEWKQTYVKDATANRNQSLAQIKSDQEQHKKYKTIFGKEFPQTFEKFRDMKYNNIKEWEFFKTLKQQRLNQMDFQNMKSLIGKLGNKETRLWYKAHDEKIPDLIDTTKSLKEQAKQAFDLRALHRMQARQLMKDLEAKAELDKRTELTFEQLVERKKIKYGLTGDDAYKDIIRSSRTTNKDYDKKAGLSNESNKNGNR